MPEADRLFTARFALMGSFSFTVFLSLFQLLPTAPFHILALGGTSVEAGLFLGLLTYASALSAPITGAVADRLGKRRVLIVASVAIMGFSILYALAPSYHVMFALVAVHGVFWSGLLSASSAYLIDLLPTSRRAEGLGYAGFASILAVAVAPNVGLWMFDRGGWQLLCFEVAALNALMAMIAWTLPPDRRHHTGPFRLKPSDVIEWRVLLVAVTFFLYSFSYGAITSFVAVYADAQGVTPRALYFTIFSLTIVASRPVVGRYADQIGHRRLIAPCLALIVVGVALLSVASTRTGFAASAMVFGLGFGSAYPVFVAHLMKTVPQHRRGATFGALIGAFDTGIGTGSITAGWLSGRYGFGRAFGVAAALAALSVPYYLYAERRGWTQWVGSQGPEAPGADQPRAGH
jgi:MFS family permease